MRAITGAPDSGRSGHCGNRCAATTDGNEWLHSEGADVVAHENTLKRLSEATRVEDWNYTFRPAPMAARPAQVFATERAMHLNDARIALTYDGPAHTDSDISVHFTDADVLHRGRYVVEWRVPVHRLLDRWQHRRLDSRSRTQRRAATAARAGEWNSSWFLKRRASTRLPSGVCRRNSRRAEASTTITRTRAPRGRPPRPAFSTSPACDRVVESASRPA